MLFKEGAIISGLVVTQSGIISGLILVYRAARNGSAYDVYISRLRSSELSWQDILGPDHLAQSLVPRSPIRRGQGTTAERDAAIPTPALGDEWFNTDLPDGGAWQKHNGTEWK